MHMHAYLLGEPDPPRTQWGNLYNIIDYIYIYSCFTKNASLQHSGILNCRLYTLYIYTCMHALFELPDLCYIWWLLLETESKGHQDTHGVIEASSSSERWTSGSSSSDEEMRMGIPVTGWMLKISTLLNLKKNETALCCGKGEGLEYKGVCSRTSISKTCPQVAVVRSQKTNHESYQICWTIHITNVNKQ